MPLDSSAKATIALLEQGFPVFPRVGTDLLDITEVRRLEAETPTPPAVEPIPVRHVEDHLIPGPAGAADVPVRVYRPAASTPMPIIVFLHGGGWVFGDLDGHDPFCRAMSIETGSIVVSAGYRLAPEHPYPSAAEDAYAALCWAAEHTAELGGAADRIAVAGDSSGGNLAASIAIIARDRNGPPIAAQLLFYAPLDPSCATPSYSENANGCFLTAAQMRWFWEQYLGPGGRAAAYAAPLRANDLSGLSPACIITAEFDPLRDEGEAYGQRLREAGVYAEVRRFDGMFHGFLSAAALLPAARQASETTFSAVREFVRRSSS